MAETFESWAEKLKHILDEYGAVSFTRTDSENSFIGEFRLLTNPYRIEFYRERSDNPTTTKMYTSEESFFQTVKEKIYSDRNLFELDYIKDIKDNRRFFLFELSKGYPRGFNMRNYTASIEKAIEHINASHKEYNFNIAGVEIFGDSFELAVEGDHSGWQVHFIRYLVDKTDLTEFRDDMAPKSILSYTEIEHDYLQ